MHDAHIYRIKVQGQVDERDLNAMSPLRARLVQVEPTATLFAIHADQSGLIGLIRHLHGRGLVLLSIDRE